MNDLIHEVMPYDDITLTNDMAVTWVHHSLPLG
jgi:hypothetical protein